MLRNLRTLNLVKTPGFTCLAFLFFMGSIIGCQPQDLHEFQSDQHQVPGIFGGKDVDADDILHQIIVKIRFQKTTGSAETCTGALISPEWIVTAAHCLPSENLKSFQASIIKEDREIPLTVKDFLVHPEAKSAGAALRLEKNWSKINRFDIGLIKVSAPIKIEPHFLIRSYKLDENRFVLRPDMSSSEIKILAAGFGDKFVDILTGERITNEALQLTSLTVSNQVLQDTIVSNQRGEQGVCLGDSGGPLFFMNAEGSPILYGVAVSVRNPGSSQACNGEGRFIDIRLHQHWIRQQIEFHGHL